MTPSSLASGPGTPRPRTSERRLSVGWTRSRADPGLLGGVDRRDEMFVKAAFAL
jgi:hypothetical protein